MTGTWWTQILRGGLVLLIFILISPVAAVSIYAGDAVVVSAGDSAEVTIRFDEVPSGISGYNISLAVSDPHIGEITRVVLPIWAFPSRVSRLPSDRVWITGADFSKAVQPGTVNVTLATVTIHGLASGRAGLVVVVNRIDDDDGFPVKPSVRDGTVTVGEGQLLAGFPPTFSKVASCIPEISLGKSRPSAHTVLLLLY